MHGVEVRPALQPKSDIYLSMLPMLNSRRVELLDNPRLCSQLCALERRTARGGRDSIDHAPGAHDDIANAVAGVLVSSGGAAAVKLVVSQKVHIRVNFMFERCRLCRCCVE